MLPTQLPGTSAGLRAPAVGRDGLKLGAASDTRADRQSEFAALLGRARTASSLVEKPADAKTEAREAAADFVAAALVEPVLKELRNSNQAAAPFAPGTGEKQFRGLMDAQMARRVTRAANFALVDRVAQMLLDHAAKAAGKPAVEVPSANAAKEKVTGNVSTSGGAR